MTIPPSVAPLKSWPSLKKHLARESEFQETHAVAAEGELESYSRTGMIIKESLLTGRGEVIAQPSRSIYVRSPLSMVAHSRFIDACQSAFTSSPQARIATAVLYKETKGVLNHLVESEFPGKFGRNLRMLSIDHAGWVGLAAGVGAVEVVECWAPLLVQAQGRGFILEHDQEGMHHFCLRLWCAARGVEYPKSGYPTYDVTEGVLDMWDTPDTEKLGQWVVQLCNLHTRQTGPGDFKDYANEFSHCPVEVMMLFRLREQRGLANPEVEHPLMKFPWSRIWPIQPAQPDELLTAVHRRLEADEGITVTGLYEQFLSE